MIEERIRDLNYDICVIMSDYRASTSRDFSVCRTELQKLFPSFKTSVFGVFGNHDFIAMVPQLEATEVRMLLNESIVIQSDSQRIHLAGIDDPYFYRREYFEKALEDVQKGASRFSYPISQKYSDERRQRVST